LRQEELTDLHSEKGRAKTEKLAKPLPRGREIEKKE
jgi:hypothetical protein